MRHHRIIANLTFAALLWTGAGESSNPLLASFELPLDVLNDCAAVTTGGARASCTDADYRTQWVNRTPRGHLFLVERGAACEDESCHAWLVEKDASGTRTLLQINGEYRMERAAGSYPSVQTRAELASSYTSYNRFEWSNERYARTETRLMHRIDGFECGNETECRAAAEEALSHDQADRAVRIWQQVHGVDWI